MTNPQPSPLHPEHFALLEFVEMLANDGDQRAINLLAALSQQSSSSLTELIAKSDRLLDAWQVNGIDEKYWARPLQLIRELRDGLAVALAQPPSAPLSELLDLITLMPDSQTQEIIDYITTLRDARTISQPSSPLTELIATWRYTARDGQTVCSNEPRYAIEMDAEHRTLMQCADELEAALAQSSPLKHQEKS